MPRFRIFQNDVPTINASDLIRNKKNKEIYSGVKNAVDNNQMTSEGYTFDSGGCLRSAPSYDAFLALTRGWSLGSIRYEDISNISTSNASDFADPGAPWAQRYNTINLTNYDIVRDASLNSVHNTGGKYAINVIHRDISSLEMNNLLTGSTINPNAKYSALNPAYSASIQLDPSNILYSTGCSAKSINNNDDAKWKQLVSTQQSSEQYRNNIYRIVKNTDWQFSYPRKFNIKQSRISNNIIPNSTPDSFSIEGELGDPYDYSNNGYTYRSHTFLYDENNNTNGQTTYTFITTGAAKPVDFLIVGGGGGGASRSGGGGGAGGMVVGTSQPLPIGEYSVVVGFGGAGALGAPGGDQQGYDGMGSSFYYFDASGGGGGGGDELPGTTDSANVTPWKDQGFARGGGSGGGARGANGTYGYAPKQQNEYGGTTGVVGYGNIGGRTEGYLGGAGGGGAGGQGENNNYSGGYGSDGGIGFQNNFRTGSNEYYAGGGGGGLFNNTVPNAASSGGTGGGGNGANSGTNGSHAVADTGGGGGGGYSSHIGPNYAGGNGGSGIVVIRYQVS